MLLFRSEEHVDRWCQRWRQPRGEVLTGDQIWGLAKMWYSDDRRQPDWQRKTAEEVEEIFSGLGLVSVFWEL
jgi:hypothetical protein